MSVFREDGVFNRAMASIGNAISGLGTARDPMQHGSVNYPGILSDIELENLYRSSRIIEKVVRLLPEESFSTFPELVAGKGGNVRKIRRVTERLLDLKVPEVFTDACIRSRLYGSAYVILGINDGNEFNEPVNPNTIRGVEWIEVLDYTELQPYQVSTRGTFEFYRLSHYKSITNNDQVNRIPTLSLIHKSRVLEFYGKKLFGKMFVDRAKHDSVIQAMFNEFSAYSQALAASGNMLNNHSLFIHKMKGLRGLVQKEDQTALFNRFMSMRMGMSAIKGLVIDMDSEDAGFASRNYSGVDKIFNQLQDALIAVSDMPRSKLLGSSNSSAFSEGGESDRYEFSDSVQRYRKNHVQPNLDILTNYVCLALDGGDLESWDWHWEPILQLTLKEQAELRKLQAEADQLHIESGVLHPDEVRQSRFAGALYGNEVTLNPKYDSYIIDRLTGSQEPASIDTETQEQTNE